MKFVKVGSTVINLANVAYVDLGDDDSPSVSVYFNTCYSNPDGGTGLEALHFGRKSPEADYLIRLFSSDNLKNLEA